MDLKIKPRRVNDHHRVLLVIGDEELKALTAFFGCLSTSDTVRAMEKKDRDTEGMARVADKVMYAMYEKLDNHLK